MINPIGNEAGIGGVYLPLIACCEWQVKIAFEITPGDYSQRCLIL
jgi:hypothetical protein